MVPLRKMRNRESVLVVNDRTSSAMRWSGLASVPVDLHPIEQLSGEIHADQCDA